MRDRAGSIGERGRAQRGSGTATADEGDHVSEPRIDALRLLADDRPWGLVAALLVVAAVAVAAGLLALLAARRGR